MPAPAIAALAGAGASRAERGIEEAAKIAAKVDEVLRGNFRIENQEITIQCPEQLETLSVCFEATGGVIGKKVRFPFKRPIRVHLRPLRSGVDLSGQTLTVTEDGFEIDTRGMSETDLFLLEVQYEVDQKDFLDALVQRSAAREVPKDKEREYWMHAQLKHPKVLRTKYGRLDLQDVDFKIDVGVSSDIKAVIPDSLKWEMDLGSRVLSEREPHRKKLLAHAHAIAMRNRGPGKNVLNMLGNLQELFLPGRFSRYVDVSMDFRYADCFRGSSFYESLPFPTWPRSMTVISRADLNLEKFAAEGVLVYKKADFLHSVARVMGLEQKPTGSR